MSPYFTPAKTPTIYLLEPHYYPIPPTGHPAEIPSQGRRLDQLPVEVLNQIFARVPFHPVIFKNLRLVCKAFYQIIHLHESTDLFRSVALISYPDVCAAFLARSALPNFASLLRLRERHDAAQTLTDEIMERVRCDLDRPSGGCECDDDAQCYPNHGEFDKVETILQLKSMIFRGVLIWKKLRITIMAESLSAQEGGPGRPPNLSDTTRLLIRLISAALGYTMSKVINENDVHPDIDAELIRSVYGNRFNLTLAYAQTQPPVTSIIDGLMGGYDSAYDGINGEERLARLNRAFSTICEAGSFQLPFIRYLVHAKDLPTETSLESWIFDREGFGDEYGISKLHPYHQFINIQHLVRLMVEVDPRYEGDNKLSVLAMKQHELDIYGRSECNNGPDCILVAVKQLEEKENPSKDEKLAVANKFNIEMMLDLDLLNPSSHLRKIMGSSDIVFAKALEELNDWFESTTITPERKEELDDEADDGYYDEDMSDEEYEDTDEEMDDDEEEEEDDDE